MMDAYTHLDMSSQDPIADLQSRMTSAGIDRALIVETWAKDNYICLKHLIASPSLPFRVALCFRPEEGAPTSDLLKEETVAALRIKTADLRQLGSLAGSLESSGKWLLPHAGTGIKALKDELLSLAKLYPRLRIYLPHLGWPRRDQRNDKDWEDSISELSQLPFRVVGISAVAYFSRESYPHKDIEPFAARLLEAFGPESVVAGTDYPLIEKSMYTEYLKLAQEWISHTSTMCKSNFEVALFGSTIRANP